jgi:hypothetical protein
MLKEQNLEEIEWGIITYYISTYSTLCVYGEYAKKQSLKNLPYLFWIKTKNL